MRIPYIGITDFMTFEQVERMLAVFKANFGQGQNRRLHVGVMMSYKTLHDLETKWTKAFPPKKTIADIFGSDETMNCLHYADYDAIDVLQSLGRAIEFCGTGLTPCSSTWSGQIRDMLRVWFTPHTSSWRSFSRSARTPLSKPKTILKRSSNGFGITKVSLNTFFSTRAWDEGSAWMPWDSFLSPVRSRKRFPISGSSQQVALGLKASGLSSLCIGSFPIFRSTPRASFVRVAVLSIRSTGIWPRHISSKPCNF